MLLSQNSLGVLLKQEAPLLVSNTQVLFLRHRESFEQDFSLCVYLFADRTAFFSSGKEAVLKHTVLRRILLKRTVETHCVSRRRRSKAEEESFLLFLWLLFLALKENSLCLLSKGSSSASSSTKKKEPVCFNFPAFCFKNKQKLTIFVFLFSCFRKRCVSNGSFLKRHLALLQEPLLLFLVFFLFF